MKIKLDENLPFKLVTILSELGHETDTIPEEGLKGWNGTHYGLLLIRLRDPGRNALLNRIQTIFQIGEVERWQGCFVVVTDHKIRVRHPK